MTGVVDYSKIVDADGNPIWHTTIREEVDLVKPLPVAHLHDFGLEVAQGRVSTAVLATGFRVGWPVHVGQERHFLYPQAVNDDMHMDIAAVVMPVRVGAYKRLVSCLLYTSRCV